jgi:hypothetical protein
MIYHIYIRSMRESIAGGIGWSMWGKVLGFLMG